MIVFWLKSKKAQEDGCGCQGIIKVGLKITGLKYFQAGYSDYELQILNTFNGKGR
jgi:hypothetical protein